MKQSIVHDWIHANPRKIKGTLKTVQKKKKRTFACTIFGNASLRSKPPVVVANTLRKALRRSKKTSMFGCCCC